MFVLNVSIVVLLFMISLICLAIWIHVNEYPFPWFDLNLYFVEGCFVPFDLFN